MPLAAPTVKNRQFHCYTIIWLGNSSRSSNWFPISCGKTNHQPSPKITINVWYITIPNGWFNGLWHWVSHIQDVPPAIVYIGS